MEFEYNNPAKLLEIIRDINIRYYTPFNANILYLEERTQKNYIAFIIELRDAHSHLVRVFDYDIITPQGRSNVQEHLGAYVSHLRRGLLDSYVKIVAIENKRLMKSIHKNNVAAIELQIAQKASELRIMDKGNPIDQRIEGYKNFLRFISDIRKQFGS
jgi:hypothetical protein